MTICKECKYRNPFYVHEIHISNNPVYVKCEPFCEHKDVQRKACVSDYIKEHLLIILNTPWTFLLTVAKHKNIKNLSAKISIREIVPIGKR